jgi:hypothetical protein
MRRNRLWGPPSLLSYGYYVLFRWSCEAEDSPLFGAEIKSARDYSVSIRPDPLAAWYLIKKRGDFTVPAPLSLFVIQAHHAPFRSYYLCVSSVVRKFVMQSQMYVFIGDVPSFTCLTVESNFSNIHGQITSAVDIALVKDIP